MTGASPFPAIRDYAFLSDCEGARPVRIGHGAWDQRQHDVWGMLVDSVAIHSQAFTHLSLINAVMGVIEAERQLPPR